MDEGNLFKTIDKALNQIGITAGGPLDSSTYTKGSDNVKIHVTYIGSDGKKATRVFTSKAGYNAWIATVGDQITILAEDITEKSEHFTTQKSLIDRIKRNQKPKLEKGSTFKDFWSKVRANNKAKL